MLFSNNRFCRILEYTVKLSKQHKRKSLYIPKALKIQKLSYKIWPKFFGILEVTVNSGIRIHGFTINLMRALIYIDSFFSPVSFWNFESHPI